MKPPFPMVPKPGGIPRPGGLPGIGGARAPLPAMKVPTSTPLDKVKVTKDLQADADAEVDAMDEGFRARAKQEAERFSAATGSGEYFVVCFANGEQCDAFMRWLSGKCASVQMETNDLVVDGRDLAKAFGVELPAATAVGKLGKVDPDLKARSRNHGDD